MLRFCCISALVLWMSLLMSPGVGHAQAKKLQFLRYLPEGTTVVVVLNVDNLFKFEKNRAAITQASRQWYADVFVPGVKAIPKELGIARVDRIVIGLPAIGDPQGCLILRGKVNRALFNKQVAMSPGIRAVQKSKALTVFEMDAKKFPKRKRPKFELPGGLEERFLVKPILDKLWFAAIDDSTVFVSLQSKQEVQAIAKLHADKKVGLNPKMKRLLSLVDTDSGGLFLTTLGEAAVPDKFQKQTLGDIFRQLSRFSIRLENTKTKSVLKITAHTKDPEFAKVMHKELTGGLGQLRGGLLQKARQGLTVYKLVRSFNPKKANPALDVLLTVADPLLAFAAAMQPGVDGKVVSVTSEVPRSQFSTLVKTLLPPTE